MEKGKSLHLYLIFIALALLNCNTTEPPINGKEITLKLVDVSCTEAWISLTTTNLQLPTTVILKQNNQPRSTINLIKADSLLYIDSLLPNTNYKFQVSSILQSSKQNQVSSNEVTTTTMDTTSNNFSFETYTLGGQAGSCVLCDVAIIDENNIWAVGEIYLLDSLGLPDPLLYNAVHWDGSEWELKRIKTNACGGVDYPPIKTIFAFSSNDILFVHIDGSISYYNGIEFTNDCSLIRQLNGSANKIWGESKNDFYVVSGNGFIAHYQNGLWNKIESGTTTNINDVWGIVSDEGDKTIYCAVSFVFQPGDRKILRINNNNVVDSITWESNKRVNSVWAKNKYKQFACGDGVCINSEPGVYWKEQMGLSLYYSRQIRGTDINDVIVVGDYGFFAHYSGTTWYVYDNLSVSGIYMATDIKGNICAAVGLEDSKAVIITGIR